ncbi:hypothetical protein ES703_11210 [subsurface metagenome]
MKIVKQNTGPGEARKIIPMGKVPAWEDHLHTIEDVRTAARRSQYEAKVKAFKALAAHNYVSFAGRARVWSYLNAVSQFDEYSPFTPLARPAKEILRELLENNKS